MIKSQKARSSDEKSPALVRFHQRIKQKTADRSAAPVLCIALGDSVTQGVAAVNQFLHAEVYHRQFNRMLEKRFPLCIFSTLNAGVDGQAAVNGLERLERDVIRHGPDLVLLAFALNDAVGGGLGKLDEYAATIRQIIQQVRHRTEADVILMTPNMMITRPNAAVAEQHRGLISRFIDVQNEGVLGEYARRLVQIGREEKTPVADVYAAWEAMADRGVDTTAMLSNGLNHPTAEGHRLAADILMRLVENAAADAPHHLAAP
jgi:lysophospholipase L1-like esterase